MLLGIAVVFSVFLVMYQSVLANSLATFTFKSLIKLYFNPLVLISLTDLSDGKSPASSSSCDHVVSACALAVADP